MGTILELGCLIAPGLKLFLQIVLQIQYPSIIKDNQKHKDKRQKEKCSGNNGQQQIHKAPDIGVELSDKGFKSCILILLMEDKKKRQLLTDNSNPKIKKKKSNKALDVYSKDFK